MRYDDGICLEGPSETTENLRKKNSQTSSRDRTGRERVNAQICKRRAALSAATFGDTTTKPPLFHD
jgi:hypothetical protein